LVDLFRRETMNCLSLRVTAPIGPGMPDNRMLIFFIKKLKANDPITIFGKCSRWQNYVDVRDISHFIDLTLTKNESGVFNLGGNGSISNLDLAKLCRRIYNSSSDINFNDQADPEEGLDWDVSHEKSLQVFGYEPTISIEDSILEIGATL